MALNHLKLLVTDLDRSARFYEEALGLVVVERNDRRVILSTPEGNDALTLGRADGEEGPRFDHLGFLERGRDLEATLDRVTRAGGRVLRRSTLDGEQPTVFFADPDGFVVQI